MAKADSHHSMGRTVSLVDARALLLRSYQSTGLVDEKLLKALEEGRVRSSRIREDGTRDELDPAFWRDERDYAGCVTRLYVNWSENSACHGYLAVLLDPGRELPALPEPAYAITVSLADVRALLPTAEQTAPLQTTQAKIVKGPQAKRVLRVLPKCFPPDGKVSDDITTTTVQQVVVAELEREAREKGQLKDKNSKLPNPPSWETVNRVLGRGK
jgi:hypothetical protein